MDKAYQDLKTPTYRRVNQVWHWRVAVTVDRHIFCFLEKSTLRSIEKV